MSSNPMDLTRGERIDAFQNLIESRNAESITINGVRVSRASLIHLFSNCGDILPAAYCDHLDLPLGSKYAQAAQALDALTVA